MGLGMHKSASAFDKKSLQFFDYKYPKSFLNRLLYT